MILCESNYNLVDCEISHNQINNWVICKVFKAWKHIEYKF